MNLNKIIFALIALAVIFGIASIFINNSPTQNQPEDDTTSVTEDEEVVCAADAMMCPDGTFVGRSGPNCEFDCPPPPEVPDDVQTYIDSKSDLITIDTPVPNAVITSPVEITGDARGYWFFEGDFPVTLTNWDGLIIAETFASANGEWMTEDFVSFSSNLEFESPYNEGDPDFMKNGTLILQRDNPSGLPENDDALEIPVRFAP